MLATLASIVHDRQRAHGDEGDYKQDNYCGVFHQRLALQYSVPPKPTGQNLFETNPQATDI
jgi:hypothetical protein